MSGSAGGTEKGSFRGQSLTTVLRKKIQPIKGGEETSGPEEGATGQTREQQSTVDVLPAAHLDGRVPAHELPVSLAKQ